MFSICKTYINVGPDLFYVKKMYQEHRIKDVDLVKAWLEVDHVFRKDGNYYFCTKIEEAELINN